MPWHLEPAGDGYYVTNSKTGKRMSNRPLSRERAQSQLKALYANVPEARSEKAMENFEQEEFKGGGRWIQGAIKNPGVFRARARSEGISTQALVEKIIGNKKNESPTWVRRAYLARTLMGMSARRSASKRRESASKELSPLSMGDFGKIIGINTGLILVENEMEAESQKDVSSTPSASMGHGPSGVFSTPGIGGKVASAATMPNAGVVEKLPGKRVKRGKKVAEIDNEKKEVDLETEKAARIKKKVGNMAGLAKHMAHKHGGDPNFFTKVYNDDELNTQYPGRGGREIRAAIAARAHKIVTGIWPGAHGGKDPNANEPGRISRAKKKEGDMPPDEKIENISSQGDFANWLINDVVPAQKDAQIERPAETREVSQVFLDWMVNIKQEGDEVTEKGGAGSGNFGHAGIPGHHGGSAPGGGGLSGGEPQTEYQKMESEYDALIKRMPDIKGTLSQRDAKKRVSDILVLSKLPLAKLRKRQDMVRDQKDRIWEQLSKSKPGHDLSQFSKALDDLREMENDLTAAVDKREFGPKRKKELTPGLIVFKEVKSGKYRWIALSSNSYEDRDQEIVSTKALEADVERADADHQYGPLRWWHVPGLDIGDCDFNMMYGRMLIESGTFRDERLGPIMQAKAKELQISLGFMHPASEPDADGVFYHIKRFERSTLPKGIASNTLTAFAVKEGVDMATNKEKIEELKALLGNEELAESLLSVASQTDKEAEGSLRFKAVNGNAEVEDESGDVAEEEVDGISDEEDIEDQEEDDAESKEVDPEEDETLAAIEALLREDIPVEDGETTKDTHVHVHMHGKTEEDDAGAAENQDNGNTPSSQPDNAEEEAAKLPGVAAGTTKVALKRPASQAQAQPAATAGKGPPPPPVSGQVKPGGGRVSGAPQPAARPIQQQAQQPQEQAQDQGEGEAQSDQGAEEIEMPEVIGNMTMEEFADLLSEALATALQPYLSNLKEVRTQVKALNENVSRREKEAGNSEARFSKMESLLKSTAMALKEAKERIQQLESDVPAGVKPFIASQSDDTVIGDDHRLKQSMPAPDPLAQFMGFVTGQPQAGA